MLLPFKAICQINGETMTQKQASVIINTKDRFSRLYIVLKALEGQVDESLEVIVVFDGCSQETLGNLNNIKVSYPVKDIVLEKNLGRAAARNIGAKAATGNVIIFIDDDRIPGPDFVRKHILAHRRKCIVLGNRRDILLNEEEIGAIVSSTHKLTEFLQNLDSKANRALDSHETFFRRVLFFRSNPLIWLLFYTGNVSMDREDLVKVGFFDENFQGWGYEDLEIGYRLYKEGILFFKDKQITNYHLAHEISINEMHNEALRNLKYFSKKVKGDILAKFVIWLLKILMYIRLCRRHLVRANSVKKRLATL